MPSAEASARTGSPRRAEIIAAHPATRVIILTTFGRPGYLRRAMEAGAVGFMVKDAPADQLIEAIRRVHQGLRVVDPTLAADSLSLGASPLTDRETAGARRRDGAPRRAPSRPAVPVRRHGAQPSLVGDGQARRGNRAEAVRIATENGWLG